MKISTMMRREKKTPILSVGDDSYLYSAEAVKPNKVYSVVSGPGTDGYDMYTWYINQKADDTGIECINFGIRRGMRFYAMQNLDANWTIHLGSQCSPEYDTIHQTQLIDGKIATLAYDLDHKLLVYHAGKEYREEGVTQLNFLMDWNGIPMWAVIKNNAWLLRSTGSGQLPNLGAAELLGMATSKKQIFPYVFDDGKYFVAGTDFPRFDSMIPTEMTISGMPLYVGITKKGSRKNLEVMVGGRSVRKFADACQAI
ncbi:MAG: hypothetical protein A3F54_02145 [Candidatus Kerfeldbacteria bacterium RIFCSPHIGHO2_12_FULL_48_17]|uniref:Uncharacterized protein n=1 Tax=Candidatus Kerfeldbacteria bacterium RIFCSPHIGHO2_12_FULL_48_17 TaxID=1798542 RepID=A0A1G2AWX9_9BACT|nr:MAG: hypothetical protein A3F54_02145 [Candidatus Kerfeldbacteria bacterium RIFCSPHIGHO2_12_FULL_48_17]